MPGTTRHLAKWTFAPPLVVWLAGGCAVERVDKSKVDLGVTAAANPLANSAAYRDTIGSYAYFEGMGPMRVRGYGVVVGLGKNGSTDCPRAIYDKLVQSLYKQHGFSSAVVGEKSVKPEDLLQSADTAVVIVQGAIPPAATKGSRFDVFVSALPGTQTRSLVGGRLFSADLEMFRDVSPNAAIAGQIMARAAGPVFINPFAGDGSAAQANPLEGVVLSGGIATVERRLRLVLSGPSYGRARQIQDRINAQFGDATKVADAISPSYVQLHVPDEYAHDTGHFLALVRGLFLNRDPVFEGTRARQLADELVHPSAPHTQIAWCLEGLGRNALPVLGALYSHPKEYVSFHAAAAGLRLDDHLAADCLAVLAGKRDGEYRFQAIRALRESRGVGAAAIALRRLLHDDDPRVRIEAYEALIARRDPAVQSVLLGGDNFALDLIPASRPNLVYVKRSVQRRIALFGDDLHLTPPILYRAPDGSITLNAESGEGHLTLLRTVVATGSQSPSVETGLDVSGLIRLLGEGAGVDVDGKVSGLGLDYGAVVRALYHLHQSGALNAQFMLEQPNAAELFGPSQSSGRPESDL